MVSPTSNAVAFWTSMPRIELISNFEFVDIITTMTRTGKAMKQMTNIVVNLLDRNPNLPLVTWKISMIPRCLPVIIKGLRLLGNTCNVSSSTIAKHYLRVINIKRERKVYFSVLFPSAYNIKDMFFLIYCECTMRGCRRNKKGHNQDQA